MPDFHIASSSTTPSALDRLQTLRERGPDEDFSDYEAQVHAVVAEVEREVLAEALASLDIDAPAVWIEGKEHRRVTRCEGVYRTRAGDVRVERSLYRARGASRAVCPLELRAGIVEARWTPWAASLAVWAVAHLTPQEAEELFARIGGMTPSRSSLDRLPKALSDRWERDRPRFEEVTRQPEQVPAEAVGVAVSLDGIMVPMKDGQRQEKRAASRAAGKETRGPAGFREAACGTLALYDADGDIVGNVIDLGRMPQKRKQVLEESLEDELVAALEQRPDLRVVGVADGAPDNWRWLDGVLPDDSDQVLDFFHAVEHLGRALDAARGEGSPRARAELERLLLLLRDLDQGADKVINALAYLRRKHPRRKTIARELRYFRRHRDRMRYAAAKAAGLPIGSGIVEAANKTLVTVRMKRAGARWTIDGGQAILTFRALAKTERFDRAWRLLADTYTMHVEPVSALNKAPLKAAS